MLRHWKIKRRAVLLALAFLCALPHPARADCTSPSKIAGDIYWDSTKGYVEYCDGTTWHDTSNGTTANACTVAGKVIYSSGIYYYCNNSLVYVSMQGAYLGSCSGTAAGLITWDGTLSKVKFCDGTRWWSTIKTCQTALTTAGAGTYGVPANWSSSDNEIEVIAGGGATSTSASHGMAGGGGGGYSVKVNQALTASTTVDYFVGAGAWQTGCSAYTGCDTYFCNSQSNCTDTSGTFGSAVVAGAHGGTGNSAGGATTSLAGGSTTGAVGSTTYAGGYSNGSNGNVGGGGGGAAGPSGAGNATVSGGTAQAGNTGDNGNAPSNGNISVYWPHVTANVAGGANGGASGSTPSYGSNTGYGSGSGGNGKSGGGVGVGGGGIIIITYSCG